MYVVSCVECFVNYRLNLYVFILMFVDWVNRK